MVVEIAPSYPFIDINKLAPSINSPKSETFRNITCSPGRVQSTGQTRPTIYTFVVIHSENLGIWPDVSLGYPCGNLAVDKIFQAPFPEISTAWLFSADFKSQPQQKNDPNRCKCFLARDHGYHRTPSVLDRVLRILCSDHCFTYSLSLLVFTHRVACRNTVVSAANNYIIILQVSISLDKSINLSITFNNHL